MSGSEYKNRFPKAMSPFFLSFLHDIFSIKNIFDFFMAIKNVDQIYVIHQRKELKYELSPENF